MWLRCVVEMCLVNPQRSSFFSLLRLESSYFALAQDLVTHWYLVLKRKKKKGEREQGEG